MALHFNTVLDGDRGLACQLKLTQKMRVKGANDEDYVQAPTLCMFVSNTLIQKCYQTIVLYHVLTMAFNSKLAYHTSCHTTHEHRKVVIVQHTLVKLQVLSEIVCVGNVSTCLIAKMGTVAFDCSYT